MFDCPMAAKALEFYAHHSDQLDADMRTHRQGVKAFFTRRMTMVASPQQSKELVASRKPSIVIASSGMATGGRILYHLAATLPDPRNTVLFVGFQAEGVLASGGERNEPAVRRWHSRLTITGISPHDDRAVGLQAHADTPAGRNRHETGVG